MSALRRGVANRRRQRCPKAHFSSGSRRFTHRPINFLVWRGTLKIWDSKVQWGQITPCGGDRTSRQSTPTTTLAISGGHTAGSYIVVIASGNDRAYLLGDVVQHPLQLNDESISFLTDLDPALGARTRQRVFDAMEREQAAIGMDHFPGLGFQQIIAGSPRKWLPVR